MVAQVRSRVTPVSGHAFFSKYCHSDIAVRCPRVPAIEYL
jgi:hypothetical protein